MSELSKMPKVGKVLEENLLAVGIETLEQLLENWRGGSVLAYPSQHFSIVLKKNSEKEDDLCLKSRKQSLLRRN